MADGNGKRSGYGTLTFNAHREIRRAIILGQLVPGERLTIKTLQADLGIGPTPIREALSRLASEGFVLGAENRGYSIAALSREDLRDITDQRILVESSGLRQAVNRADGAYVQRVSEVFERLSGLDRAREEGREGAFDEWEVAHREFHAALISGAQSPWLKRFQELLFDHADRYRRRSVAGQPLAPEIVQDHQKIMDAVRDHDGELAALILSRHIERVYERAITTGVFEAWGKS